MLELTACVELNTFTMCVCSATTLVQTLQTHTHSHTIYTMHTHAHTHTYNLCMYIRQCRLTGAASATVEDLRTQTSSGFQNAIKSKKVRTYSGRYTKPCLCMSVFVCVLCQCLVVVFYVWNFRKLCLCPSATPAANEAGREATLPLPGGSPGRLLLSLVQPAGGRPGYPLHWGEHQRTAEGAVSPPPEPREQEREGCVCVCACVCMRVCAL